MSIVRRINFFGGPGTGKSTIAAKVFSELKMQGYDIEHISEYIKTWAHEGKQPVSYDQLYVFAKQLKAEDVLLRNVSLIVSDSPILMNAAYSSLYKFGPVNSLIDLAKSFDDEFPSLNLCITRSVPYKDKGRYQTYDDAIAFDNFLGDFLNKHLKRELYQVDVSKFDDLMSLIRSNING